MRKDPYARFKNEELILRDLLAADRTVLANERTLLAYVRTGLAFAAGSAGLIHFFDSTAVQALGWILIPFAVITTFLGVLRYIQVRRRLGNVLDGEAPSPPREP